MSTPLTNSTIGFDGETTYAVRNRVANPNEANTVTYTFYESQLEGWKWPLEKPTKIEIPQYNKFGPGSILIGKKTMEFILPYQFINGPHAFYWLGKMGAEVAAGALFSHTVNEREPGDSGAPQLPSRTIHMESAGLTTQKLIDLIGCITAQVDFGWAKGKLGIDVREKFLFQRLTDENATHDTSGGADANQAAKSYSAAPADIGSAATASSIYNLAEAKYDVADSGSPVDFTTDVLSLNIRLTNAMLPQPVNRTTTDNYNKTINRFPNAYFLDRRSWQTVFNVRPTDKTLAFWKFIKDDDINTDITVKFERIVSGETHSIEFTFDTATAPIVDFGDRTKFQLTEMMSWPIVAEPASLSSLVIIEDVANNYTTSNF